MTKETHGESSSSPKESLVIKYFKDFAVLKETRREYWGIQIINMLDCLAYFALLNIIVVMLSDDYGYSDKEAGYVFTVFTSLTTICLVFFGLVTDKLGVKNATYLAMAGYTVARADLLIAAYMEPGMLRHVMVVGGLILMAPCMAMVQTIFQSANRRFTTKKSRGAGFNLWYLFMNVGAAGGGFIIDILYKEFGLPRFHVLTFALAMGVLCMAVNFLMIKNTGQLYGPGEEEEEEAGEQEKEVGLIGAAMASIKEHGLDQAAKRFFRSPLWKLTVLIFLLLGVRCVFINLSIVAPKFWLRMIGDDASIGALQAFNPVLVIIGLILFIPLLHRFKIYNMLIFGALITALSMIFLVIPPAQGWDVAKFTYIMTICFLLVLTIGELIWSPRLQEYTAAIAPKGQEGTFLGLSMVPYFLGKTILAGVSGHMIARWCPEYPEGEATVGERIAAGEVGYWDSPYAMWLILGAWALVGVLAAIYFRGWFTKDMADSKSEEAAA